MGVLTLQRLIFTNSRGQSIELSDSSPFILSKIEGLGDVVSDNQSQKAPYQDGSTHIDSVLEERYINMEITILADSRAELSATRQYFSSIFNPKLGEGKLTYMYGDDTKELCCVSEHVPIFPSGSANRVDRLQMALIDLKCPNPYWKSPKITEDPTFEPRFRFPIRGPFIMGIQRDKRIIKNDGDSPIPIQVEFHGPAVNPIIRNLTTGEFIKVNQTLAENEYMRIDTTPGIKSVWFISEAGTERNVINWIDLDSIFFALVIGENEIEYSADSDIQGAKVNIYYQKYYVGV